MEASGAGVSPSPSASTSITLGGRGVDHVGLALSCSISNGRLPGDSACQPPEPPVLLTSAIWAAQPHSISGARAEARAGLDPSPSWPSPGTATGHVLPTASCPH